MTNDMDDYDRLLEASSAAVRQFGAVRFEALTGKLIWHLRRVRASGAWGDDDYALCTVWDEVCHEVQEGPFDWAFSSGFVQFMPCIYTDFDMTIRPYVDMIVKKLPQHEAVLLTLYAIEDLDEREQAEIAGSVYYDELADKLIELLREQARHRDLHALARHNYPGI